MYVDMTSVYLHNDIVDGNVYQFYKESYESHDGKSYSSGYGNLLKFWKEK